jgi:hypothetical protein
VRAPSCRTAKRSSPTVSGRPAMTRAGPSASTTVASVPYRATSRAGAPTRSSATRGAAPTSGMRPVSDRPAPRPSRVTTASTVSSAIARYVVSFPPTTDRTGPSHVSRCLRERSAVAPPGPVPADAGSTSGRRPAYAPTTSCRVSGVSSTWFTVSSSCATSASLGTGSSSGTGPSTGSSVSPR